MFPQYGTICTIGIRSHQGRVAAGIRLARSYKLLQMVHNQLNDEVLDEGEGGFLSFDEDKRVVSGLYRLVLPFFWMKAASDFNVDSTSSRPLSSASRRVVRAA